jgi:predicted CXXCH cytochrome family protein
MSFHRAALVILLFASTVASAGSRPKSKEDPARVTSGGYVGADVCIACHDEYEKSLSNTIHRKLFEQKEPTKNGCEACHGPGSEHVNGNGDSEKIFGFGPAKAKDIRARCAVCHASLDANHGHNNLSCLSCHSVHHASETKAILTKPVPDLCTGCHH